MIAKHRGKKIGRLVVRLDRKKNRYQHAEISVDLRFEIANGTFYADWDGQTYQAKTKDDLSDQIRAVATKSLDLKWTRYLVIDYDARAWPLEGDSGRPQTNGQYDTLDLTEDRAKLAGVRDPEPTRRGHSRWEYEPSVITSIDLHWCVCEFSDPYVLPEDKNKIVRMRREVDRVLDDRDETGRETFREELSEPSEQDDADLPIGAVLWTEAREALLREVLVALGRLDARLVELFRGDPDQLAGKLDAAQADPSRLLAAPPPDPEPSQKKRRRA